MFVAMLDVLNHSRQITYWDNIPRVMVSRVEHCTRQHYALIKATLTKWISIYRPSLLQVSTATRVAVRDLGKGGAKDVWGKWFWESTSPPFQEKKEGFRKWKVCGEVGKRIAESGEKIHIIVSLYTDLCCPCTNPWYSSTFCKETHCCCNIP